MADHVSGTQCDKTAATKVEYEGGFEKSDYNEEEQMKKLVPPTSTEDLLHLDEKFMYDLPSNGRNLRDSESYNLRNAEMKELNSVFLSGMSGVGGGVEPEELTISSSPFDDMHLRLSESLNFPISNSSATVRRERLHSSSDNEEDLLEVSKDLPEIHSFGSPGAEPLAGIEACNFHVRHDVAQAVNVVSVPAVVTALVDPSRNDGPVTMFAFGPDDCTTKIKLDLDCDDSFSSKSMPFEITSEASNKNVYGLPEDVISSNSIPDKYDGFTTSEFPSKPSSITISSSPFSEVDLLGGGPVERRSPARVHAKAHTPVHPVVSIEITAPVDSPEETSPWDSSDGNFPVTEAELFSGNLRSCDHDSTKDGSSTSSSQLSDGSSSYSLSATAKHPDAERFISKTRSHSFGEIEVGSSRRSSTNSVFGDAVDNSQYDSDVSGTSSGPSRPVSPSDNSLFSKVHAKVKDKRKRAALYFKTGHGSRRNSDSAVVNECGKKIFLEVPGETSDSHQTIMETNLVQSSNLSKSDSRLNEKQKPSKKRRLSESRVIVKLKGLKSKKSHHGSHPSLSSNTPQEVTLSPDPFADEMRAVRRKDGRSAPREVDFQHSETYYENLKLAPPASRSRSPTPTPLSRGKKGTSADASLPDNAVDDYYGTVESIYDVPAQEIPVRKPLFSLDGFRNVFRGKSRSVDHTSKGSSFPPIDSLRHASPGYASANNSVEGSKENVAPSDRSSSTASIVAGSTSSLSGTSKTSTSAPTTTTTYTVESNDTLMSIAARFDTTPSELTKLNRLSSRYLFPGQSLLVPLRCGQASSADQPPQPEAKASPAAASSADLERALDQECLERFLKLQVRHVTDGQGIVGGVLLVTPNAIMFDPDVSDPLVLERGGADTYGFICPMECLANAAIYNDIATMRVKDTKLPRPELPKPEIYYSPAMKKSGLASSAGGDLTSLKVCSSEGEADSPLQLVQDATFPELSVGEAGKAASSTGSQDDDSSCSCGGDTRDSSAFPKAFEQELLTPDTYPHSPLPVPDDTPDASQMRSCPEGAESPTPQDLPHHEPLAVHSQPLMTIDEDTTTAAGAGARLASRNVSCDSAVSVSSEADVAVGGGGGGSVDSTFELLDAREAVAASTPPVHHLPEDCPAPSHASRKQKVLKRLSNPLSWMDSLGSDGTAGPAGGSGGGGSTPPVGGGQAATAAPFHSADAVDAASRQLQQGAGVLSSVFNMTSNVTSNVSSMLTRRSSLDLARRSSPHSSQEALPTSAPASNAALNTPGTHKRAQFKDGSNVGFRSLVPVDDVTSLFSSVDKMVGRKSADTEEAPLYLCLRMGLPKRLPRSPFLSYGTKVIKAEYWFSIPRSKAPDLCRLLDLWGCGVYGEVDDRVIKQRGLTLILEDTDLSLLEDKLPSDSSTSTTTPNGGAQLKEITKESWEVPMSDDLRRLLSSTSMSSVDIEAFLPEMLDPSEIVDHQTFKNLYRNLPPRFQSYSWRLTFSTAQHGFSLSSLYRKMQEVLDSPVLLAVQDTQQTVFGALLSNSIKVSDGFYGTGESFIFTCYPTFQVCNWTAENTYFVKGNNESLVIGGGDHFGIWLDGDLYRGRSQPCKTYNNPVLGPSEDFVIKTIECWSFV